MIRSLPVGTLLCVSKGTGNGMFHYTLQAALLLANQGSTNRAGGGNLLDRLFKDTAAALWKHANIIINKSK